MEAETKMNGEAEKEQTNEIESSDPSEEKNQASKSEAQASNKDAGSRKRRRGKKKAESEGEVAPKPPVLRLFIGNMTFDTTKEDIGLMADCYSVSRIAQSTILRRALQLLSACSRSVAQANRRDVPSSSLRPRPISKKRLRCTTRNSRIARSTSN